MLSSSTRTAKNISFVSFFVQVHVFIFEVDHYTGATKRNLINYPTLFNYMRERVFDIFIYFIKEQARISNILSLFASNS